ncbi:MAG: imidazole glycerol phosphate synthase subunit HisF [Candidatus Methanomethylophilaceae archaeon]|nr:imidazole glycerol phosphate synthase subunit HisF [Candidatus Methanomethylophilaceae archaeon]
MLAKRIIPCLDMKGGRVVKGINFKGLRDVGDPVELASLYEKQGADEITFLDISASLEARRTMLEVVSETARNLTVPLAVGGGIKNAADMREALNAGADKVSVNSSAVKDPDMISECSDSFGCQCVIVAIDAKRNGDRWEVYTHGGTRPTGLDAVEWAQRVQDLGAGEILLTSMDADGVRTGYDIPLTAAITDAVDIPVIASGGCGTKEHIAEVFMKTGASAALAASIFHYNKYTVGEVKDYLRDMGIAVR